MTPYTEKRIIAKSIANSETWADTGRIWGHTYEFDLADTWERMEECCRMISGKDDIFYGTNRDVLRTGRQEV